jgi:hypothetical protein
LHFFLKTSTEKFVPVKMMGFENVVGYHLKKALKPFIRKDSVKLVLRLAS